MLIKYYPLVSEVVARVIPLLKGEKSNKEDIEYLEKNLIKLQNGMRDTEKWLIQREKEIQFFRWVSLTAILFSIINLVALGIVIHRVFF